MNKYLIKIAEQAKQPPGPFRTAVEQGVASILLDIAGGTIGGKIGSKFGIKGAVMGTMLGSGAGGLAASYAVLKHHSLAAKGQTK